MPEIVQYAASALTSVVLLATAFTLWRRGLVSELPVFLCYLVLVAVHGLVNLVFSFTHQLWWFYSFYAGAFLTTLLGFAVLYEVARSAVSTPAIRIDKPTFFALCAAGAVLAVFVAINTHVEGPAFVRARILLEASLRVMQVSLLAIFVLISMFFGLLWRRIEFGIILGYGIYAASQLSVVYLRASGSPAMETVFVLVPVLSYLISSVVWCAYSSASDSAIRVDVEQFLADINDSRATLERIH